MQNKRIIIGGGGTGGHVFPAISIANAIRERYPETEILFVGAEDKLEMEKVPEAGYRIIGLPVAGFRRKPGLSSFTFFYKLWKSMQKSKSIIKDFQPHIAVGVGGYASGPILRAASARGIPVVIQEQNSYAGITNKLLAKKAASICVAYPGMEKYFPGDRIILTGNPVRKDILKTGPVDESFKFFGFDKKLKTILVIGGSQGARTINESITVHFNMFGENIQLLWQTGKYYFDNIWESLSGSAGNNIRILPFIREMHHAYTVADLIISRAGAGTISELAIAGKPVILVPSPNVAEDHQTKNARSLTAVNAALHISDTEAKEMLVPAALDLLNDPARMKELSGNLRKLAIPDSSDLIVNEIVKWIK